MNVKVRLYGTLGQLFPDYQHSQGVEVDLPEGATIRDLFALLGISESRGAVVIADGRVLRADDRLQPGVVLNVMQTVGGG